VPDVVPYFTGPYGGFPGSPVWQSAYVVIASNLHKHYGELALPLLREVYAGLCEFMAYLGRNQDPKLGLVVFGSLGDWVPPGGNSKMWTPVASVTAFYWIYDLLLSK